MGAISKWCSVRYTLSPPSIAVVENWWSSWRNVGKGFVSRTIRPLSAIVVVSIRWNCWAIHHRTVEHKCPLDFLRSRWLIRFWTTMKWIPILLHSQCKRQVWDSPLHCPKLTKIAWDTLVNSNIQQKHTSATKETESRWEQKTN